jgi:hypothetical protein
MALKLPENEPKKRKLRVPPTTVELSQEDLAPEDEIEYSVTMEVSPSRGQKAWIKVSTRSSVRAGETTDQAKERVYRFVDDELDRRIDELGG